MNAMPPPLLPERRVMTMIDFASLYAAPTPDSGARPFLVRVIHERGSTLARV